MVYNDYELLRQFVESALHNLDPKSWSRILILDDYSRLDTRLREYEEYLRLDSRFKIINFLEHRRMNHYMDSEEHLANWRHHFETTELNLGHAGGFNLGIDQVETEFMFYLDVDTVFLRKAYGGGWSAMGPKELGIDLVFAWPTAECASMGPEGAAEVIWAKEIRNAPDPEAARKRFAEEYDRDFATPYLAAALRVIDDVIYPAETRQKIVQALQVLEKKENPRSPAKHGIMPI